MSGSILGSTIRSDVANADFTVPFFSQVNSDGSQGSVAGTTTNINLIIDTVGGAPATDLFLGGGYSYIQNANDTSPILATGTDAVTTELVYEGDAAGQTFYAGTGNEYAAFTGFGNVFTAPETGGGTYEVSAGLVSGSDLVDLAPAPSVGSAEMGNTIVASSGNASIAAGLGYNAIFLGSGTAVVANEGTDSILGSSGAATVDGGGSALVFTGTGAFTYDGSGGTATVVGSSDSTSGAMNVLGGTGSVSVYGGAGSLAAYGGSAGGNVLVGGSGNSTLVGGGNNDTLVGSGTGTNTLVAGSGNETLFGAGASGTTNYFLGSGTDQVVAGTGSEYIQFGEGTSTVFGSTGSDVYGLLNGTNGGSDLVVGFNATSDYLDLQGFGTVNGPVNFSDVTVMGGSSYISGTGDSTTIELYGVTNLTAANFI